MSANDGKGTNGGPKAIAVPQAAERGTIVRQSFGGEELERIPETASTALAAQARAAVEARFIMAMQRPRSMEKVRVTILAACVRPFFADTAVYGKPVGKKLNKETGEWEQQYAYGLSIRFAEEAIRCLGNAMTETTTIYDDDERRIVRAAATDFETNVIHYKDVTVEKTVERRVLRKGQAALGQRENSYGDLVFIVAATEDEFTVKVGATSAKALRDKILMLIPSDIKEEGKALCFKTNADQDAINPEAARRKVIDGFAKVGVNPDQLAELLDHDLATILPGELQRLRAIYAGISEGESTWAEVINQKRDGAAKANGDAKPAAGIDDLAARAKAQREAAKPSGSPAPAPVAKSTKPVDPADAISTGPGAKPAAAKPGQQTIPAAARKPLGESDEDRLAREAAAPRPGENVRTVGPVDDDPMPSWGGGK